MARATPLVSEDVLTYHTGSGDHTLPIGTPAWWRWLNTEHTTTFRFENAWGSFTARREQKNGSWYWYACHLALIQSDTIDTTATNATTATSLVGKTLPNRGDTP